MGEEEEGERGDMGGRRKREGGGCHVQGKQAALLSPQSNANVRSDL